MQLAEETEKLFGILNAEHVSPDVLESGFSDYSKKAKNKLALKVATTFEPTPSARLLQRLLFILTKGNKQNITNAYVLNLNSTDAQVRRACLYGLQKLAHPALKDFALNALKDTDYEVLVAASTILLDQKKQDKVIQSLLKQCYQCHKNEEKHYTLTKFLEASSLNHGAKHD